MATATKVQVRGIPYCKSKTRGNVTGLAEWTRAVQAQTQHLPKIKGPCHLKVSFYLPPDKFPPDHPYGPDLDNLTKRLWDALGTTVFSCVAGKDGCVVELHATKHRVETLEEAGALIEIRPATIPAALPS